jgi:signal transduction histidine kinase
MHRLRAWGLDVVLVLLAGGEAASLLTGSAPAAPVAAAFSALSALVFVGRRWQPLAVSVAAFALSSAAFALSPQLSTVQFFGVLATFALTGATNRPRDAVVGWLAGAGMLAYGSWHDTTSSGLADYALTMAFATTMWGAGALVRRRTSDTAAAVLRAERAERDQEEQARRAVAEERARLARELHDVVSHGLSVIVLQTMAARAGISDGSGDDVDRHLDAVEEIARESLGEMRRMLGLLQSEDLVGPVEGAPAAPAPGLSSLPALIDRADAAGLRVTADLDVDAELPSGLELSIYRVVQEALTNAVKHAPGSAVDVAVRVDDGRAVVTVANDAGVLRPRLPEGAGHGLIGMRQRTALYGGTLSAGPTADGGFALSATFPLPEPAAPRRRFARRDTAS